MKNTITYNSPTMLDFCTLTLLCYLQAFVPVDMKVLLMSRKPARNNLFLLTASIATH